QLRSPVSSPSWFSNSAAAPSTLADNPTHATRWLFGSAAWLCGIDVGHSSPTEAAGNTAPSSTTARDSNGTGDSNAMADPDTTQDSEAGRTADATGDLDAVDPAGGDRQAIRDSVVTGVTGTTGAKLVAAAETQGSPATSGVSRHATSTRAEVSPDVSIE